MNNTIGELKLEKIVLAVAIGCTIGWFVYSRFSFKIEQNPTDGIVVIKHQLQEMKVVTDDLRRRVEGLERRLPENASPPVPKQRARQKSVEGK